MHLYSLSSLPPQEMGRENKAELVVSSHNTTHTQTFSGYSTYCALCAVTCGVY